MGHRPHPASPNTNLRVLVKQGSFAKAGDDARAGLALFSGSESLPAELEQERTIRARAADLGVAVEQAAARTSEVSMTSQTIIEGPLLDALKGESTLWFLETEYCALPPGSEQRFLATLATSSCITLFASGPDRRAFGAHINGERSLTRRALDIKAVNGGVPSEQKMLKGNLARVVYDRVHFSIRI